MISWYIPVSFSEKFHQKIFPYLGQVRSLLDFNLSHPFRINWIHCILQVLLHCFIRRKFILFCFKVSSTGLYRELSNAMVYYHCVSWKMKWHELNYWLGLILTVYCFYYPSLLNVWELLCAVFKDLYIYILQLHSCMVNINILW